MSDVTFNYTGSSRSAFSSPSPGVTYSLEAVEEEITIAEFEQSRAVSPSGSLWSFVTRTLAEYLQSSSVANASLISAAISLAETDVSLAQTIAENIARCADSVPSFESVHVNTTAWGFECRTIVHNSTEEDRFRLYDIEWTLMQEMPDVGFRFNVIDRENMPLEDVVTLEPADGFVERKVPNAQA